MVIWIAKAYSSIYMCCCMRLRSAFSSVIGNSRSHQCCNVFYFIFSFRPNDWNVILCKEVPDFHIPITLSVSACTDSKHHECIYIIHAQTFTPAQGIHTCMYSCKYICVHGWMLYSGRNMRSTYIAKFRRILTSCTHKMDRSDAVQKMEETAGTNLFSRRSAAKRCQLGQASR